MIDRVAMPAQAAQPAAAQPDPRKLKDASRQFETLLITQMIRSMREASSGGWLGTEDQASSSILELGEEQLAQALASQGGIGLANLVAGGLKPPDCVQAPSKPPSGAATKRP